MLKSKKNYFPAYDPKYVMKYGLVQYLTGDLNIKNYALDTNKTEREIITFPDDDSIEIIHYARESQKPKPIALLLPGINGTYECGLMLALAKILEPQWHVIFVQYRGCVQNATTRQNLQFAGDHRDMLFLYETLQQRYQSTPIAMTGTSLGGNLLLNLLANEPQLKPLCAATSSTLFCLKQSMDAWHNRVDKNMLNIMRPRALQLNKYNSKISLEAINKCKTCDDYVANVVCPLLNLDNKHEYYAQVNVGGKMKKIITETLIMHSENDFVCPTSSIPLAENLNSNTRIITTKYGGHSSFSRSLALNSGFWASDVIADFFNQQLAKHQNKDQ